MVAKSEAAWRSHQSVGCLHERPLRIQHGVGGSDSREQRRRSGKKRAARPHLFAAPPYGSHGEKRKTPQRDGFSPGNHQPHEMSWGDFADGEPIGLGPLVARRRQFYSERAEEYG
ncbi:hypothetical protein GGTG_01987 [Gaeumannomyces tritici R3-111a-1]|uniref:Uncharacterized protein n=1 Tax=Gaeumannomyces tritici (strain R3-111a-1) TaxID=644352 RepID=J3NL46_GAET3|nr:hypothetical protein GGTG_01987 [Gaeumannomyces tritici R3-111a-1]EJT82013.1 hypothetical protein GGTG_01987 [Gaeumannomyces tritici R3-111a-1]